MIQTNDVTYLWKSIPLGVGGSKQTLTVSRNDVPSARSFVCTITYNGKTQTIHQWSIDIGLNEQTLTNRINRGWSIERALTTKPNVGNNQYTSKK